MQVHITTWNHENQRRDFNFFVQKKYFFLFLLFKIFIETGELPERDKTRQASLWIIARTGKNAPKKDRQRFPISLPVLF